VETIVGFRQALATLSVSEVNWTISWLSLPFCHSSLVVRFIRPIRHLFLLFHQAGSNRRRFLLDERRDDILAIGSSFRA